MPNQRAVLLHEGHWVTSFSAPWRNDASFRNQTETSPSLSRRERRCKMRRSLSEYVSTYIHTRKACCTSSALSFRNTLSSFTASAAVNFLEALHLPIYVISAPISFFEDAVANEPSAENLPKYPALEDRENLEVLIYFTISMSNVRLILSPSVSFAPRTIAKTEHWQTGTEIRRYQAL